jgi:hypothetical protein
MKAPAVARNVSTAIGLRREIEKAEADGVLKEDMTLELTLQDVSNLKRDRTLAVTDIGFAAGAMSFLGVKIVQGGYSASVLRRTTAA